MHIVSCLFVCFTLAGGTNTGLALNVTVNNVLKPALANPLGDVETVQVILYRCSFIYSSVRSFVLSSVEFLILHLSVRQTGQSVSNFFLDCCCSYGWKVRLPSRNERGSEEFEEGHKRYTFT